jgi:membrane-associated protein
VFYARYGKKTIVLARFIPIVRTFAPIVAGVAEMHYPTFLLYNVVGAALWAIGLPLAGFYLHELIPDIDRYLLPIIAIIIILSILPPVLHMVRERRNNYARSKHP